MAAAKTYTYLVYSPAGALLGAWPDAPRPQFGLRNDGYDSLNVRLPRRIGLLDVPGDASEGPGTLAHGNRVDIYIADADTVAGAGTAARYGTAVYGSAAYGLTAPAGRLVWRGVIMQIAPSFDDATVDLLITPLIYKLSEAKIDYVSVSGDVAVIARSLVETYGGGLSWDAANTATAGVMATVVFRLQYLADALGTLRDLAGVNWQCFVTPAGSVRFSAADVDGTPTHRLVAGVHANRVKLVTSAINRRKRVTVGWANGTVTAKAVDWSAADPRDLIVDAGQIADESTARALAEATLAERDRLVWRGSCTVLDGAYDIESIAVGDTVRIYTPAPLREGAAGVYGKAVYGAAAYGGGAAGFGDYAGRSLVVAGLTYNWTAVDLELSETQPRISDQIRALMRRQDAAQRRQADAHLTRDDAGTLKTTDALTVPAAATIEGATVLQRELQHEGTTLGFYDTTPVAKPTVAGAWTDPVGKLLAAAIAQTGLIRDNTT